MPGNYSFTVSISIYPEIHDWVLMGPYFDPLVTAINLVALFILIESGRLDDYIDRHVDTYVARLIYRGIRVISAILHWYILISLIYYGHKLDYNLFCEAPSKLEEHIPKPGLFKRFCSWLSFSKDDKTLNDDAKTIASREMAVAGLLWWFVVAKLLEQVEQVVAPMSYIDIKYIDVVHHMGMTIFAWIGLKKAPGGSTAILEAINCVYLSFAYTHASFRSFLPGLLSDDAWERSKTVLLYTKNIHFLVTIIHCFTILLHPKCGYPKGLAAIIAIAVIALLIGSFFPGSPSGGGGSNDKSYSGSEHESYSESENESYSLSDEESYSLSDEDDHINVLDRLNGYGNYDDLVSAFTVQKPTHNGSLYVSTGRSFP